MLYFKLPYFKINFLNKLKPFEINDFRKIITNNVGLEHLYFHNHDKNKFLYHYPPIQYKSINDKAVILFLGKGIDDISFLISKISEIKWHNANLEVDSYKSYSYNLVQLPTLLNYQIKYWLPLQYENLKKYNQLNSQREKEVLLASILKGNILSFAKGVGWNIENEIVIDHFNVSKPLRVSYKKIKFIGFHVNFACNVFLPPYIGLGKGAGKGYGTLNSILNKTNSHKVVLNDEK